MHLIPTTWEVEAGGCGFEVNMDNIARWYPQNKMENEIKLQANAYPLRLLCGSKKIKIIRQ